MSKRVKSIYCFVTMLTILGMILVGCTSSPATAAPTGAAGTPQPSSGGSSAFTPIVSSPLTLTYWCALPEDAAASITNFGDSPMYKEIERQTGIHIAFTHPALGQETEQFNLLIASGSLPDILEWDFINTYPGGVSKAFSDNVIIPLNDLMAQYAPDLMKIVNDGADINKTARKMMMTDDGKFWTAPYLVLDSLQLTWQGPQIRQDLLDKLNIAMPVTIDDWTAMLTKFRDDAHVPTPFSVLASPSNNWLFGNSKGGFAGAYGVCTDFYLDNGAVKYGPIQPGYKDYLTLMESWYQQKLFDQDFATQDRKTLDAKVTNGEVGSYIGNTGGSMGRYLDALRDKSTTIKLTGAPWPVLKKGDSFRFGQKDFPFVATPTPCITPANKHQKESMQYLNYGYTQAGHMVYNFGVEGVSYTMVNGYPTFTDLILKNPKGLTSGQAMSLYERSETYGPLVSDNAYFEQYALRYPEQKAAVKYWTSDPALGSAFLPPVSPTPDESKVVSQVMTDVNTYMQEMFYKFVMGQESLTNFDAYVTKIQDMGIDKVIKIYTDALDRYNKR